MIRIWSKQTVITRLPATKLNKQLTINQLRINSNKNTINGNLQMVYAETAAHKMSRQSRKYARHEPFQLVVCTFAAAPQRASCQFVFRVPTPKQDIRKLMPSHVVMGWEAPTWCLKATWQFWRCDNHLFDIINVRKHTLKSAISGLFFTLATPLATEWYTFPKRRLPFSYVD